MQMLAEVDPELVVPADRVRALSGGRWELKAVIDEECQRGLEQLKGLLSHVDPQMTLGQLVGRLVKEGLDRHDPGRPRRGWRTANRTAGADHTSAPKRSAQATGNTTPPAKTRKDQDREASSSAKEPVRSADTTASVPKSQRDSTRQALAVAKRPARRASYALGGSAEPDNLRLLCFAHHRRRHAERASRRDGRESPAPSGGYGCEGVPSASYACSTGRWRYGWAAITSSSRSTPSPGPAGSA